MGRNRRSVFARRHARVSGLPCRFAGLGNVYRHGRGATLGQGLADVWRASRSLRDARGYDAMDEYLLEEIIHVGPKAAAELSALVGDCAARTNNALLRAGFEPGTAEAFRAYVACLHQMYLMGMAVQLKRMGYRMTLQEL